MTMFPLAASRCGAECDNAGDIRSLSTIWTNPEAAAVVDEITGGNIDRDDFGETQNDSDVVSGEVGGDGNVAEINGSSGSPVEVSTADGRLENRLAPLAFEVSIPFSCFDDIRTGYKEELESVDRFRSESLGNGGAFEAELVVWIELCE
jgi:hypothetical protein